MPIDNIKLKLLALRQKQENDPELVERENFSHFETDKQLVNNAFPHATETEVEKMVRNLPQERKRAKVLLATRLGKTEVKLPNTDP